MRLASIQDGLPRDTCVDCGVRTCPVELEASWEYYMVLPEVWAASGLGSHDGMLCLDCLETRLGRPLTGADFNPDIPINTPLSIDTPRLFALKLQALLL